MCAVPFKKKQYNYLQLTVKENYLKKLLKEGRLGLRDLKFYWEGGGEQALKARLHKYLVKSRECFVRAKNI